MRRRSLLIAAIGLGLTACAPAAIKASSPTPRPASLAIPAQDVWPLQYRQAPAPSKDAYAFAMAHPEILHYMPCFCACGREGHRDNYDCFIRAQTAPGRYLLDPHGLSCGVCVGVALDSKSLLAQGLSRPAIRATIDAKWAKAGATTPTPYPAD
jgi:uncharacterized protein with PCYCGC motif